MGGGTTRVCGLEAIVVLRRPAGPMVVGQYRKHSYSHCDSSARVTERFHCRLDSGGGVRPQPSG
ncbi:hypothetical protein GBAR_LOCUS15119 [Geodia barretti]|uniref:Uncharacterized protein n=1 Tax=Geodia barretti TaxID=519541 RepID=A0AA35SBD2_GEOBA|nr:hypothetical protein GBAR_LOCUS15119 [Geodia barretti]